MVSFRNKELETPYSQRGHGAAHSILDSSASSGGTSNAESTWPGTNTLRVGWLCEHRQRCKSEQCHSDLYLGTLAHASCYVRCKMLTIICE